MNLGSDQAPHSVVLVQTLISISFQLEETSLPVRVQTPEAKIWSLSARGSCYHLHLRVSRSDSSSKINSPGASQRNYSLLSFLGSLLTSGGGQYSEKTLSIAIVSTAVISILVGFLAGFVFTKKCSSKDQSLKCGHANLEALMLERYVRYPPRPPNPLIQLKAGDDDLSVCL